MRFQYCITLARCFSNLVIGVIFVIWQMSSGWTLTSSLCRRRPSGWTQPPFDNGVLNLSVAMNRKEWCGWNRQLGLRVGHAEPDVSGAAVRSVLGGTIDVAHMEIRSRENFGRLKVLECIGGWNSFADPRPVRRRRDVVATNINDKSEGDRMSRGIDGDPLGEWETRGKCVRTDFVRFLTSFC